jgi:translation initiation factor IF-1
MRKGEWFGAQRRGRITWLLTLFMNPLTKAILYRTRLDKYNIVLNEVKVNVYCYLASQAGKMRRTDVWISCEGVSTEMACLASSPGRMRRTDVWISREDVSSEMACFGFHMRMMKVLQDEVR